MFKCFIQLIFGRTLSRAERLKLSTKTRTQRTANFTARHFSRDVEKNGNRVNGLTATKRLKHRGEKLWILHTYRCWWEYVTAEKSHFQFIFNNRSRTSDEKLIHENEIFSLPRFSSVYVWLGADLLFFSSPRRVEIVCKEQESCLRKFTRSEILVHKQ